MATPLQNVYYERKTATARPCYICNRPTQTVLATLKTEDFLYTCDGHLSDPGFATKLAAPAQGPTQEDIRKVVSEYQAREARRAAAQAKKTDEDKDKDKEKEKKGLLGSALEMGSKLISGGGSEEGTKSPSPAPASPASEMTGVPSSNVTTHNKYALHRHIFEARRNELRRKEMNKKAKETAQGLPQVPRGSF